MLHALVACAARAALRARLLPITDAVTAGERVVVLGPRDMGAGVRDRGVGAVAQRARARGVRRAVCPFAGERRHGELMILHYEFRTHHPTRTGNQYVIVDDDGAIRAHQNLRDPAPGEA